MKHVSFHRLSQMSLIAAGLIFGTHACAADIRVDIEGLPDELEENVRAHLGDISELTPPAAARAVRRAAVSGLKALGYYTPEINIRIVKKNDESPSRSLSDNDHTTLTADIRPGEQIKLQSPEILISGQAQDDPDFVKLVKSAPAAGAGLNHGEYEDFKSRLQSLALEKGYFDAQFTRKELLVSPETQSARWALTFESGRRYRWGSVTYEGSQIDPIYLKGLEKFKKADPYDYAQYADLNKRLGDTGWFASVAADPDFKAGKDSPDKELPVTVTVSPRKRNLVETGLGYASDIGPTAKVKWTRPWVNAKGHSLSLTTQLSADKQSLEADYRIPTAADPIGDYWMIQGGYKYTDLNDTQSSQLATSVSRNKEFAEGVFAGWVGSLSVNVLTDNYTQAEVDNTATVIYPGISITRTRAKGGLSPYWGDTQRYALSVANGIWGSDSDFIRAELSQTWLRTFALKHRFVARITAGWIETDDIAGVPPDLRFFAGGDNSIRGYDYESISPTNKQGELTGGAKMLSGSLEYQYNITGNWWSAAFVDAGDSVRSFGDFTVNKGAGIGIRWNSPIGPVKLDFAWPIASDIDHGLHIYVGLGGAL